MSKTPQRKGNNKPDQTKPSNTASVSQQSQPLATQSIQTEPDSKSGSISSFSANTDLLKKIFYGSLAAMLLICWITGYNVGYHQDEMDMNNYGQANYAYYFSGGKDTSFLISKVRYHEVDSLLRFYGSAFEYIAVGATKLTGTVGSKYEFDVRHACNQAFAILALLFTGLIARKLLGDWRASIIAIWLAFLSPSFFGHFLFNTKDIPFCAGYLATTYYILWFLHELPTVSWKTTLKLMLSFAFTTDIRIGGVLLLFYLAVFFLVYVATKPALIQSVVRNALDIGLKLATIVLGGMTIVVLTWPFLLRSPIKNLIATLEVVRKFPLKININFDGLPIDSLHVPNTYIPKFMSITTPIYVLIFILAGVVFYFVRWRRYDVRGGLLLLFTIVFPVAYAIATGASLYSGWRHFLFIYPGLCILASAGVIEILDYVKKPALQIAFGVVSFGALANPIMWSVRNHPYEYCYFNEFAGGFKNTFSSYDNDYWEITVKRAVDKLMTQEPNLGQGKDSVWLASNVQRFVDDYMARHYPKAKIKAVSTGVTGRNSMKWTYAVYNSLFLKPDYLNNFFPPEPLLLSEDIDGMPVTVVLKDTARLDFKALDALKLAQHSLADSLYTAHMKTTKDNNSALFAYMSVVKGSINQNDEAIQLANKCLQYHFSTVLDYNCYCGLGIAYANKRQFAQSINYLQMAVRIMPNEAYAKDILKQVNAVMGQPQ